MCASFSPVKLTHKINHDAFSSPISNYLSSPIESIFVLWHATVSLQLHFLILLN